MMITYVKEVGNCLEKRKEICFCAEIQGEECVCINAQITNWFCEKTQEEVTMNPVYCRARCMEILTHNGGMQALIDYAQEILGTPLLFQDGALATVVVSSNYPRGWRTDFSTVIIDDEIKRKEVAERFEEAVHSEEPYIYDISFSERRLLFVRVSNDGSFGGLLRIPEIEIPLESLDMELVKVLRDAFSIAVRLYRTVQVEDNPSRGLYRLLSNMTNSELHIENCDVLYDLNKEHDFVLLVIPYGYGDSTRLRRELRGILQTEWMTECDGYICVLLAGKQAENSWTKTQKEELNRLQKTLELRIAISDRYHRLLDSYSLFQDLKYAMDRWEKAGILCFDQVKMDLLIRRIQESQIPIHRYLSNVITDLKDYDKENDGAYFETLKAYCNYGKNVAKTAQA
ncbi:MAG: hypothetical protein J6I64_04500, partial [Lachnospiraceae bacterium]|nr:hypothetical protein [Lachnospiraceae bacterium]